MSKIKTSSEVYKEKMVLITLRVIVGMTLMSLGLLFVIFRQDISPWITAIPLVPGTFLTVNGFLKYQGLHKEDK